jgi:hypothetical protein
MKKPKSIHDYLKIISNDPNYSPKNSYDWFRRQVTQIGIIDTKKMVANATITTLLPGQMYMFGYDPKYKDTLPYYDKYPIIFPFAKDATSFTGINFHYLSGKYRMQLLHSLEQFSFKAPNNEQKLILQWQLISNASRFPGVRSAVKKYLFSHCRSKFIRIPSEDWLTAIMLPTHQFVGARDQAVWAESRGL